MDLAVLMQRTGETATNSRAEKGHRQGKDVYAAFGQTFGGKYLSVSFIYEPNTAAAVIISARGMTSKE